MAQAPLVVTGPGGDFVTRYYPHARGLLRAQGWRWGAGDVRAKARRGIRRLGLPKRGPVLPLGPSPGHTG